METGTYFLGWISGLFTGICLGYFIQAFVESRKPNFYRQTLLSIMNNPNIIKMLDTCLTYFYVPNTKIDEKSSDDESEISKLNRAISSIVVKIRDNERKVSKIEEAISIIRQTTLNNEK